MIEQKYSTFWARFCAGVLDSLIFAPIGWLIVFLYSNSPVFGQVILYLVSSSLYVFYSICMHAKFGQTLGKMAFKVIVLDVSERPLCLKQAVLRDILSVVLVPIGWATDIPRILGGVDVYSDTSRSTVDWIIYYSALAWFLIEVITMLTNNKRRALHDFIAGSVVIRKPKAVSEATANANFRPTV